MISTHRISCNRESRGILRFGILLGLTVWAFYPEFKTHVGRALESGTTAHFLTGMAGILFLVYRRRSIFRDSMTEGSAWGIGFIILGFILLALASWPFSCGYGRDLAIIPVLAGIIATTLGNRVLRFSLPLLFLFLLAIPLGDRIYCSLIIRPETITLSIIRRLLNALPGITAWEDGLDTFFSNGQYSGVIALGEYHRAAGLFMTYAVIGVVITFARVRTAARVIASTLCAVPILLFCNFIRSFLWALLMIYFQFSPTSGVPRMVGGMVSISVAYLLFALLCGLRINVYVDSEEAQDPQAGESQTEVVL